MSFFGTRIAPITFKPLERISSQQKNNENLANLMNQLFFVTDLAQIHSWTDLCSWYSELGYKSEMEDYSVTKFLRSIKTNVLSSAFRGHKHPFITVNDHTIHLEPIMNLPKFDFDKLSRIHPFGHVKQNKPRLRILLW